MKKIHKILILIIIILLIILISILFFLSNKKQNNENYDELIKYVDTIYSKQFLIPEFNDINKTDPNWFWDNINQYLNNNSEFESRNRLYCSYTYDEIYEFAKVLYGNNISQELPKDSSYFIYNPSSRKYGPTAYSLENYYDYQIDNIEKNENIYTVSIYDYTISYYRTLGENPDNLIDIYNNYDFLLNGDNGTPILSVKSLKDENYLNILNYKNQLSHKILTIEYDENSNQYHIKSCKYEETKPEDLLATAYSNMQKTFEVWYIQYDYAELYDYDEVIVENYPDLISIYSDNAVETYKNEMNLFEFKDGDVFIKAGDINIGDYISNIEFKNIKTSSNRISCDVIRTFRESFDTEDEKYNNTYTVTDHFSIILVDDNWIIDEFSYNNKV